MKKSKKKISLEHYDKRIAWAALQNPTGMVDIRKMEEFFNDEIPYSCPYCDECQCQCWDCMLSSEDCNENGMINYRCCDGHYARMNLSLTWNDWLVHAKKTRAYIKAFG